MPLITTKGVYGLTAMYELSKESGRNPIQIKIIAQRASIPYSYLEQLLNTLKKAELVESIRGAKGGYFLAKKAENIKVFDILVALEGKLIFADYAVENKVFKMFFNDMDRKIKKLLNINLSEFQKYENILNDGFVYMI